MGIGVERMKARWRAALGALFVTVALVASTGTPAMASPGGVPDEVLQGGVGLLPGGEPVGTVTSAQVAGAALGAEVALNKTTVEAGGSLTASWAITGGDHPVVTGAMLSTAIEDGPLVWMWFSDPVAVVGGMAGSATMTVPVAADIVAIGVFVEDGGQEFWFQSDFIPVTGANPNAYSAWGLVADTRTDEYDDGYYSKGAIAKGWFQVGGNWFYSNAQGFAQYNRWLQIGGGWYFFDDDGVMATDWIKSGQSRYYMGADGRMRTGWVNTAGAWYHMDASGAMQAGWVKDGQAWYYLSPSGIMTTGWVQVGGQWYYLRASGAMATGWVQVGGQWYYLHASGTMATGWVKVGASWYFLNAGGAMHSGWLQQAGSWYYLNSGGAMVSGRQTIDGRLSDFRSDGVWLGYVTGSSSGSGGGTGSGGSVYYANCAAVRAAGKAPLYRGQPGYGSHLDRDGDGIACER